MAPRESAERRKRIGWDAREPGALAIGLVLFLIAAAFPWWGFTLDTSTIPYISSQGTELSPWAAEEWEAYVMPGTLFRRSERVFWWDYAAVHPEYASYGAAALVASSLWIAALLAGTVAFRKRFKPGPRYHGWPTYLETGAAVAAGIATAVAGIVFPSGAGLSFAGSAENLSWGPRVGWILAAGAMLFFSVSAVLGAAADRSLKGLCWKCYRGVAGPVCRYCEAAQ